MELQKPIKNTVFTVVLVVIVIFTIIVIPKYKEISKTEVLFSTFVEIKIKTRNPKKKVEKDIKEIFEYGKKLGDDLDFHVSNSYVDILNKNRQLIVPEKYIYFFKLNFAYIKRTEGYFNPFLKNLEKLYNYFEKGSIPPEDKIINKEIMNIKSSKFIFKNNKLKIIGNASLDFGGSAKGYIVDQMFNKLISKGYKNFLINAGGDIKACSNKKQWIIGIQSPIKESDIIGTVNIKNNSIVTSGNYERYFIYNGRRYFHILNPFTGKPDSDLSSVTVINKSCFIADILSTAIFAMGRKRAISFIEKNNIKAFLVWFDFNKKMYYYDNAGINLTN